MLIHFGLWGALARYSSFSSQFHMLWVELHFGSKKSAFLEKSSKTIDILPVFFEPKWIPWDGREHIMGMMTYGTEGLWTSVSTSSSLDTPACNTCQTTGAWNQTYYLNILWCLHYFTPKYDFFVSVVHVLWNRTCVFGSLIASILSNTCWIYIYNVSSRKYYLASWWSESRVILFSRNAPTKNIDLICPHPEYRFDLHTD